MNANEQFAKKCDPKLGGHPQNTRGQIEKIRSHPPRMCSFEA